MSYRPEIDGIRALAVLSVLLYHAGVWPFAGGYVGVDVFFVISGYLITSLLTRELADGTFSLSSFYERRARRILPALFAVLACSVLPALLLLWPPEIQRFSQSVLAAVLFSSNVFFWKQSGYFGPDLELQPLLHTWSLGIEEQYYLLFPVALLLVFRFARRWLVRLTVAVAAASLALATWASMEASVAAFYLLPTRGWELLLGALVSFLPSAQGGGVLIGGRVTGRRLADALGALGLVSIVSAMLLYDDSTPIPGLPALVPTLGTALLLCFAGPQSAVGRLLSLGPLRLLGLISYSVYLWHQPLGSFARFVVEPEDLPLVLAALVPCSLGLGYLSWRFVEVPYRRRGPDAVPLWPLFAAGLVLAAVGVLGHATDGLNDAVRAHRFDDDERAVYDLQRGIPDDLELRSDGACRFHSGALDERFVARFSRCAAAHGGATIVLGDSHAMNIFNAVYSADRTAFLVGLSKGGCRPHLPTRSCFYEDFVRFADEHASEIAVAIFHQSGAYLLRDSDGKVYSDDIFFKLGATTHRDNLLRVGEYLDALAASNRVAWLGPYVEARVDLRALRTLADVRIPAEVISVFGALEVDLRAFVEERPRAWTYLSLNEALRTGRDSLLVDGCLVYRDGDHFSPCGEDIVGERLVPRLGSDLFDPTR